MIQQILALIIIAFFVARLFWQKQKKQIAIVEFVFWLFFWIFAGIAIIFLKWLDKIVAGFGFTASGIDSLLYLSIAVLFYLIFRLRLKLSKIERDITKIVRYIALKK
ncbi:MAG: DUF2304 family protein [Patescibacteria group bacterium]|nr:DUF2304 family protein [Patescibacteria group bacterium]MBU1870800.1 DUF2304 family protein [Patescibacteria group bacterium]